MANHNLETAKAIKLIGELWDISNILHLNKGIVLYVNIV